MVDKGGLEYTIRVKNDSSNELAEFRRDVNSTRTTFSDFKAELAATSQAVAGVRDASRALTSLGNPANSKKIEKAAQNIRLMSTDLRELGVQANALGNAAVAINSIKTAAKGIGNAAGFNKLISNLEKLQNTNFITISAKFNVLTRSLIKFDGVLAQVAPRIAQVAADIRAIGSGVGAAAASAARGLAQIQVAQANSLAQQQATAARLAAQLATTQARAQAQQQTIAARTAAGIQVIQARAAAGIDRVTGQVKRLGDTARVSQSQLVRLGTAFLAFQAFRFSTDAFKALVTGAIEFNSELEQAQIALTAILSSAGDVRDLQGELVTGARSFALAEGVAASQIKKLQVDALKTTATFRELLDAFKQGLAPGLTSGLDPDQIRQVTVLLTNAATAVGVQGNQLAEEIRSVISGTVDLRNTRLSRLLPRDFNEQMKSAREAGKTFEFLTKQFAQFGLLADQNAKTFSAALGRVRESFDLVIGAGALPFFNSLKDLLNTITSQLVDVNLDSITPKPEAIAAFRGISDGLATVAVEAKRLVENLKASDVVNLGVLISEGFKLLGTVGFPILEGLIRGFNKIAGAILPVIKGLRRFSEAQRGLLETTGQIGALALTLKVLGATVVGLFAAVLVPLGVFQATVFALTGTTVSLADSVKIIGYEFLALAKIVSTSVVTAFKSLQFFFLPIIKALAPLSQAIFLAITNPFSPSAWGKVLLAAVTFFNTNFTTRIIAGLGLIAIAIPRELLIGFRDAIIGINKTIAAHPIVSRLLGLSPGVVSLATAGTITAINAELAALGVAAGVVQREFDKVGGSDFLKQQTLAASNLNKELKGIQAEIVKILEGAKQQDNSLLFSEDALKSLTQLRDRAAALLSQGITDGMEKAGEAGAAKINEELGTVVAKPLIEADEIVDPKELEAAKQRLFELTDPFGAALQKKFGSVLTFAEEATANLVDLIDSATKSLSNALADGIVDALDPANDETILERVNSFLKELLKMFISTFAQIAIARAIAFGIGGAAGGAGGALGDFGNTASAGGGGFFTAAKGGRVTRGNYQASPAHYAPLARTFSGGGSVIGPGAFAGRPRGVPSSDTVPAWLTPDEHVIRRAAVLKAGRDFAEFFNRGGVSRTMALEIMGRKRPKTVRVPSQAHFAGGGAVSVRQIGSAGGPQGPALAVIASSDQAVQSFLRGGRQAHLRILQEDQQAVRGAIGVPG